MKHNCPNAATNPMTHCRDCKYWKKQPATLGGGWCVEVIEKGLCGFICEGSKADGAKAETINAHGEDSGLITDPDFACIHGTP